MYFITCFMFLFQQHALAYIDPSTATYIVQIIAGIFIAGGMMVGIFWHKIKRFFKKNNKDDITSDEDDGVDIDDDNFAD